MLFLDNEISHDDTLQLSYIYLHGSLQTELGYDLLRTDSIYLYNKIYNTKHKNDKFYHSVILESEHGGRYHVLMFIWKNSKGRVQGLVCDENDMDDMRYCLDMYKGNQEII